MDQNARQQIIDRLKSANNVLVTVSSNPSVDQLAACIGITLVLNHLGKHATAVFSGEPPSTIEFLKPEQTLEKDTNSLRDFIIALDKSKADKLRYKVEDKVVKIFITPYRTSLTEADLEFSQGDFNVDAVLALGVVERTDLDQAITAHGRILHDATVISVNNRSQGDLGAINFVDLKASSLSEMMIEITRGLTQDPLDAQMATAFMTGIVAETNRFSNDRTSPRTMALASELMAAGADQQLIANKLDNAMPIRQAEANPAQTGNEPDQDSADGSLRIEHNDGDDQPHKPATPAAVPAEEPAPSSDSPHGVISIDKDRPIDEEKAIEQAKSDEIKSILSGVTGDAGDTPTTGMPHRGVLQTPHRTSVDSGSGDGPSLGGQLTANSQAESSRFEPSTDAMTLPDPDTNRPPILNRPTNLYGTPIQSADSDKTADSHQTLSTLEASVGSPHAKTPPPAMPSISPAPSAPPVPGSPQDEVAKALAATEPDDPHKEEHIEDARKAVEAAEAESPNPPLKPLEALNSQRVDLAKPDENPAPNTGSSFSAADMPMGPNFDSLPASPTVVQPTGSGATHPLSGAKGDDLPMMTPTGNPNLPDNLVPKTPMVDTTAASGNPSPPPPVPPPFMPQNGSGNAPL